MTPEIDLQQAERIAVLETKVDAIIELLKPMAALYQAGKIVLWIGSAILSYTHWDQVMVFFHQWFSSAKH